MICVKYFDHRDFGSHIQSAWIDPDGPWFTAGKTAYYILEYLPKPDKRIAHYIN